MQNVSNINERLQILNDYIQRTIDALNEIGVRTRTIAQGLSHTTETMGAGVGGLGQAYGTGGFVNPAIGAQGFGQGVPGLGVQGLGAQGLGTQGLGQNVPFGLSHTGLGSPFNVPFGVNPAALGNPYGLGVGGLSHTAFAPTTMMGGWPMSQMSPLSFGAAGINPSWSPFGSVNPYSQMYGQQLGGYGRVI